MSRFNEGGLSPAPEHLFGRVRYRQRVGFNEGGLSPAPEQSGSVSIDALHRSFNEGGLSPAPEPVAHLPRAASAPLLQ